MAMVSVIVRDGDGPEAVGEVEVDRHGWPDGPVWVDGRKLPPAKGERRFRFAPVERRSSPLVLTP